MDKWEYEQTATTEPICTLKLDKDWGDEGWELAGYSATFEQWENHRTGYTESGTTHRYIFKRRLPNE